MRLLVKVSIASVLFFSVLTGNVEAFPTISVEVTPEMWEDRETWFTGAVSIRGHEQEAYNFDYQVADIRGRGNSTWNGRPGNRTARDKRPIRFRFPEMQSIMGSDYEARTWILLANHLDQSLLRLRTEAAFYLGRHLTGLNWTPSSQFVHLYVNGEYMGVYQLTDERDIYPMTTGRLSHIQVNTDPALAEFVIERDDRANRNDERRYYDYVQVFGVVYDIRFPSGSGFRSEAQGRYVYDFLSNVSLAIRSGDWGQMQECVDIEAFIDFFIVQELIKNQDIGFSSVFMQILNQEDGGRRLVMGPLWDFDISAGNSDAAHLSGIQYFYEPGHLQAAMRHYWFGFALQVPEFQARFLERWDEVMAVYFPQMIQRLQYMYETYAQEFARNFERHEIMGVNVFRTPEVLMALETHGEHVAFLIEFLEARAQWLNEFWHEGGFEFRVNDPSFNRYLRGE